MSWWVVFLVTETYLATGFIVCHSGCVFGVTYHYASDVCWPSQVSKVMPPGLYASLSYLLHQVLETCLGIEEMPCFPPLKKMPSSCVNTSSQELASIWNKSDNMYSHWPVSSVVCSILLCLHICWRYIRKRLQNSHQMAFPALLAPLTLGCGIRYCWKFRSCIPTIQPSALSTISCVASYSKAYTATIYLIVGNKLLRRKVLTI